MNGFNNTEISAKKVLPSEFMLGLRHTLPILIGVIPFGITCGLMGITVDLTGAETLLMSLLVFAGASQFVSMNMLGAGMIDGWIIILTTLMINLRHLLMGASLAPYMTRVPLWKQAVLAFGMVDESYALLINRIDQVGYSSTYQFATSLTLYTTWQLSTLGGILLGSYITDPLRWGLDFAMPATFLVLLMPRLEERVGQIVALIAGVVSVLGALYLPGKWYIILAAISASLAGGLLERKE